MSKIKRIILFIGLVSIGSTLQAQSESMLGDVDAKFLRKLIDTAKVNYPKMRAWENRVKIAALQIQKERRNWWSTITISQLFTPANTLNVVNPVLFNGYQLGLVFNLGNLFTIPKNIEIAKQQMAISQYEKQEYIFSLEFMVKERYYNYLAQKAIVRMYTSSSIDAESSVKAMRYKFSRGEVKLEDYNGTILLLAQQQQLKIQGEGAMLIAKAKLEEVVGKKLEDVK